MNYCAWCLLNEHDFCKGVVFNEGREVACSCYECKLREREDFERALKGGCRKESKT